MYYNSDKPFYSDTGRRQAVIIDDMDDLVMEYECGEGRCRDMFWEFIYIIVIPAAVLFMVVFLTSIVLCFSSCRRKKKETPCDETQLLRYNTIRRASLNLRHLSHNRDTPLLSSRAEREARTASLNLGPDLGYRRGTRGTASAPGTLQRDRDRHNRHTRDRNSDLIPSQYTVPRSYPSEGEINVGSGVEYAEVHHGLSAAGQQDRLVL